MPIWVSDPIGWPSPRLTSSTPAMRVVATAPRPTVSTPSFPVAGAIVGVGDSEALSSVEVGSVM